MKRKNIIVLLAVSICMVFSACSGKLDSQNVDTSAETSDDTSAETSKETSDMTDDLMDTASRLMGALDYIDCIGSGNIPKDENDVVENNGRKYAKVCAQFSNTSDLEQYMTENFTDELIQNKYSNILGTDQPYYIDIDGVLYGYVTAKGGGYQWIIEDGEPVVTVSDVDENNFTVFAKFDNYGGECEMKLDIVFIDGFWKIASISYDGLTF